MTLVDRASSDYVVDEKTAAKIIGTSKWTLRDRVAKGDGPRRLKLSPRRVGYRMSDLEAWLRSREMLAD